MEEFFKKLAKFISEVGDGNAYFIPHPMGATSMREMKGVTNRQLAASTSLLGSAIGIASPPVGGAMALPDLIYDAADMINDPGLRNGVSLSLDLSEPITKLIPGEVDDVVVGLSRVGSNFDDFASLFPEDSTPQDKPKPMPRNKPKLVPKSPSQYLRVPSEEVNPFYY